MLVRKWICMWDWNKIYFRPRSSTFAKPTVPCHAVLNHARVVCLASVQMLLWKKHWKRCYIKWLYVCVWKANQSGPPWYPLGALCTRLLDVTRCIPMGHGSGLHSGAHRGTVRFALAYSGPHREGVHCGTLPDQFGTGTFALGAFKCPSGAVLHGYGTL